MTILGIDPGSSITGFGIISADRGRLAFVAAGALRVGRSGDLPARLRRAADGVRDLILEHAPDEVCVERVFQHANVHSALVLAHVRGAILAEVDRAGLACREYTALQIKKALVGQGHAAKEQVRSMVQRLLRIHSTGDSLDVSDALAVAICHAHAGPGLRRWEQG
ncbi:MAG TPA: crossover junction endodeoxyribonuclease RuvC [Candidatus Polarisedimenticolia bacterium]|nr:crossover junction endodeoxyribonuclease RuvC [Candidatus Polarisedimenticolia bacterium]